MQYSYFKIMSSHHIIKDDQEPALIIANGESCSAELLGQLLEWSPTVMVLDGAWERVHELGIKIDVLLGDFDRLEVKDLQIDQQIEIVHTPDQNKTDLQKGIEYFISKKYKAIHIIWATGLRADHNINNIVTLTKYKDLINLVMWDDYSKIFVLNNSFEKWYPKATPISLIPIGKAEGITTSGLKYNLNNEVLDIIERTGSSNEAAEDGLVKINYKSGFLLMMECND